MCSGNIFPGKIYQVELFCQDIPCKDAPWNTVPQHEMPIPMKLLLVKMFHKSVVSICNLGRCALVS